MKWFYHSWDFNVGWCNQFTQVRCVGFRLFGHDFDHYELSYLQGGRERRERISKLNESRMGDITEYKRRLAAR